MEIIAELEPDRRGLYAGAVGYVDFTGDLDTAIALRTMVVKDGVVSMQAGGGIVADSTPDGEYAESLHKMRGLLRAIELAEERSKRTERADRRRRHDPAARQLRLVHLQPLSGPERAGAEVDVRRNDKITVDEVERWLRELDGIVISPGPCTPNEAGISVR